MAEGKVSIRRIVPNLRAERIAEVSAFYQALFGLSPVMDHGWIVTLASTGTAAPQISIASQGGSGTEVPDLSIEVDDVDEVWRRAGAQGCEILYPLTDEPWGVRRFFLRDPTGRILNILGHTTR